MGQQSLIYSFVSRGTVILAEYTDFTGNFTSIASQCLQKLPTTNNKFAYNCDGHTFNYLVEDAFTYCVVAAESAGRQVPMAFLERTKDDFNKKYSGGKADTAVANSLNKEFGPKLKEQMQYYVDHPEEISKLSKVKAQVSEVKGVMMENIEKVLDCGEKIELIVDKTENLRSQKMADQRKLDIEAFHNLVGYLSDPPAEHYEEFNSLIVGLNSCRITHALKANPVICIDMIKDFWLTAKVNRSGAEGSGSIDAKIQGKDIVISEAVVREVLKFDDQPHHPTTFGMVKVMKALRKMSYEGDYPTVLKKLFPPYWRLLVHVLLFCLSENKGGLDQLNQIQASAMVALVNNWDYNFSAFVFDNMKSMLENPKKKIFMLYPRFIQMILDEKYPELVKSANVLNLKSMGPNCFDSMKRNRDSAKRHQFLGKYPLKKHGKFGPVVGQVSAPFVGVAVKPDIETENLVTDDEGIESDVDLIESEQAEVPVRELPVMNSENLVVLIESITRSLENPPSKRKVIEDSDSDEDTDVDVVKLQNRVIVLEQDSILKDAQIASLQVQVTNKDQTIEELQNDVKMLMSTVFDLKAKLEKKSGREFADKDDDPMSVEQRERTSEEREATLNGYLETTQKKSKLPQKKQSNKQMLIMKNQDVNHVDENFQPKDPTKTSDRYVMELGKSHYDKVGNKSGITSWRYDHDKKMWLVIRDSGHREYYSKESQFESWTKIDLKNLLRAPYHDSDPNQRGRGWAFLSKLEREVKYCGLEVD
ncbi:putative Longin domain, v-SNARE, coiled-coil domain-containing protein [Helianthus annuus]|nr:putative Longin domain, v-SNARE, coiled-coil domain-containing protein [Helianthus annuus]